MAQFLTSLVLALVFLQLILLGCSYLIMLERKVCAWIQDRIGPNRTGFSFGILPLKGSYSGLGQPLADGVKLIAKEDYTPPHVDKPLFLLAPMAAVVPALIGWAVIPWGGLWHSQGWTWPSFLPLVGGSTVEPFIVSLSVAPISIGVIWFLAIGSLAVYGVVLGGYASNNKYSFLGGLRATAQMISYEIPMSIALLVLLMTHGTAMADEIVLQQASGLWNWNLFYHPLLAVIYFTCVLAECNRAPFDLAEAEQELVGGYHTEYASMKWALFFMGEYSHMITGSAVFTLLFLGGWDLPFIQEPAVAGLGWGLIKISVYIAKVTFLLFAMMWIRWTLPRPRFDQLMKFAWRNLIPLTLLVMLIAAALVAVRPREVEWAYWKWTMLGANIAAAVIGAVLFPLLPEGPPVNRRVPLEGSRFCPAR